MSKTSVSRKKVSLDELNNQITKNTSACFEPTLDYVVIKIPRWNFDKFKGSDTNLGLQMKSVGEVMAIGRSFQEALQKGCQSLEIGRNGLGADGREITNQDEILKRLKYASSDRIFRIYDAFRIGIPIQRIHDITKIDFWFLRQIEELVVFENELRKYTVQSISKDLLLEAKIKGFADRQIAHLLNCLESEVFNLRQTMNINRVYKLVDTCAAEFVAKTPYYYSTFEMDKEVNGERFAENESISSDKEKIIVLGSGPNRIGQGIEFDYSCVHGVLASKECGYETIMINCNPETVSTDNDTADKLYFEPVFWEHIYDIILHEKPKGVIVQLGGQTALKLAEKLERYNINIMGTSYKALDVAEDRGRFSELLEKNNIPFPKFAVAQTAEEAINISKDLNFPILVRPSYVLGGQGMKIVINEDELEHHIINLLKDIPGNRVLLDHYLDNAIEAEADAICDGKDVYIIGIMEHIEPCGIHSGDSACSLPPYTLGKEIIKKIEFQTEQLAKALKVVGLINIQFAVKGNEIYVLEVNPRASRTVPFVSKATGLSIAKIASRVMAGEKLSKFNLKRKFKAQIQQ